MRGFFLLTASAAISRSGLSSFAPARRWKPPPLGGGARPSGCAETVVIRLTASAVVAPHPVLLPETQTNMDAICQWLIAASLLPFRRIEPHFSDLTNQ